MTKFKCDRCGSIFVVVKIGPEPDSYCEECKGFLALLFNNREVMRSPHGVGLHPPPKGRDISPTSDKKV